MFGYFQHDLCKGLERSDFFRFSSEFRAVIHDNIPTVSDIVFLDPPEPLPAGSLNETEELRELRLGVERAVEHGQPVLYEDVLLLPFELFDSTVVARVSGIDSYVSRKISRDWLDGLSSTILRECMLVKRASIDPLTGLLSSLHLEEYLDTGAGSQCGFMVLITVYPKSSSSFQAKKYQHRTVSLLKTFVDNRFPLYYLGQSCFGIVCEGCDTEFIADFSPSLLDYLKSEGCYRVHVASAPFDSTAQLESDSPQPPSETLMKKVWTALHVATRRGPFAFCNYDSLERAADHPLALAPEALVRWLRRHTRSLQKFSLLQFDGADEQLLHRVLRSAGSDTQMLSHEYGLFVLLPDASQKEALDFGRDIIHRLYEEDSSQQQSNCGISCYPSGKFKKSEMLLNCRKALSHAAFLEPGAVVVCDAVSCNIAGDMYYGDGDIVLAVKEYKHGLVLDPGDGNLLNSLGVCYAQMNRHKLAMECFGQACKSRKDRFMALYNLGLEQQILRDKNGAIETFVAALVLPVKDGEQKARMDMGFQLAVLYVEQGEYQKGLELLLPWYRSEENQGREGKALRFLGEIYAGLGRNREAMKYLQLAMRHDEYNADVLSLLGEIYLKENEGDDIALRFCEKAVELSPDSPLLQLRLGTAQIEYGDFEKALQTLKPCLRNKTTRAGALLQRGLLAFEQGRPKEAERWFVKAASCPVGKNNPELRESARYYLKKLRE